MYLWFSCQCLKIKNAKLINCDIASYKMHVCMHASWHVIHCLMKVDLLSVLCFSGKQRTGHVRKKASQECTTCSIPEGQWQLQCTGMCAGRHTHDDIIDKKLISMPPSLPLYHAVPVILQISCPGEIMALLQYTNHILSYSWWNYQTINFLRQNIIY